MVLEVLMQFGKRQGLLLAIEQKKYELYLKSEIFHFPITYDISIQVHKRYVKCLHYID